MIHFKNLPFHDITYVISLEKKNTSLLEIWDK